MSKLITDTVYVTSAGSTEGARGFRRPGPGSEIGIDATFRGIRDLGTVLPSWFAPALSPGLSRLEAEAG